MPWLLANEAQYLVVALQSSKKLRLFSDQLSSSAHELCCFHHHLPYLEKCFPSVYVLTVLFCSENGKEALSCEALRKVHHLRLERGVIEKNEDIQFITRLELCDLTCDELTLKSILKCCPLLQDLSLDRCLYLSDVIVHEAVGNLLHLSALRVTRCFFVSMIDATRLPKRLMSLNLDKSTNLRDLCFSSTVTWTNMIITECNLSFTGVSVQTIENLLRVCPVLQDLTLVQCSQLKDELIVKSRSLVRLNLKNSFNLSSLSVLCQDLDFLNVSHCKLMALQVESHCISSLELCFMLQLQNLTLSCASLRSLNLSGCRHITFNEFLVDKMNHLNLAGASSSSPSASLPAEAFITKIFESCPLLDAQYFATNCVGSSLQDYRSFIFSFSATSNKCTRVSNDSSATANTEEVRRYGSGDKSRGTSRRRRSRSTSESNTGSTITYR